MIQLNTQMIKTKTLILQSIITPYVNILNYSYVKLHFLHVYNIFKRRPISTMFGTQRMLVLLDCLYWRRKARREIRRIDKKQVEQVLRFGDLCLVFPPSTYKYDKLVPLRIELFSPFWFHWSCEEKNKF